MVEMILQATIPDQMQGTGWDVLNQHTFTLKY